MARPNAILEYHRGPCVELWVAHMRMVEMPMLRNALTLDII